MYDQSIVSAVDVCVTVPEMRAVCHRQRCTVTRVRCYNTGVTVSPYECSQTINGNASHNTQKLN